MSNQLGFKSINDLLGQSFFIPSYQRGYRWKYQQVTELLDDIWEFSQKPPLKGEFYCLQPVVVKKINEINWEVIDGQQRLTTIFLILKVLEIYIESDTKEYTISYDTRPDSEKYLKDISKDKKDDNIDYFHIYNAFLTINEWFKNKANNGFPSAKSKFISPFLENTKFIWYVVESEIDPIDIFTRINMGKIPLTNAELIKALLLSENKEIDKSNRQFEIAAEWDVIEYKLQNDNFWYFLNASNTNMSTRIEFIFNLISNKKINEIDNFFTFHFFNKKIKEGKETVKDIWQEIKNYFMTFEEWFENNDLYHLIGYLISIGNDIIEIKNASLKRTKKEFKVYLRDRIREEFKNIDLAELDYENSSHKDITKVLLLFNIETIIQNKSNMKFPFDRYKNEKWSLEHIHAQNSKGLDSSEKRESWLNDTKKKLQTISFKSGEVEKQKKLIGKITELLDKNDIKEDIFKALQEDIFKLFGNHELHSIDNLALLSGRDNSALNNSIFPIKRDLIMKLDKNASFIPICTKNVFLKYYSTDLSQVYFWSDKDREEYLNAINIMLKDYLPIKEEQ